MLLVTEIDRARLGMRMSIIEQNVSLLHSGLICKQIIKQGNNAPTLNVRIQCLSSSARMLPFK